TVVYHIVEGTQYHVSDVSISGNQSFSTDTLSKLVQSKPGERYDRRLVQADMARIRDYAGLRGYPFGVREEHAVVAPGVVQVNYQVEGDRGIPDRVGRVIIEGNTVTQDRVILNQVDLRPGQVLQYPKIEDARMRLARLGIFDPEDPPSVEVVPNEFDQ